MKKIMILTIILSIFLILILFVIINNRTRINNPCKYILENNCPEKKQSKAMLIFIKGYEYKRGEGCKVCTMKFENYSQWKRLNKLYGSKIHVIGYYSKDWKEIINSYGINFNPMNQTMEKRLKRYSSITLICDKGKTLYSYKGEIDIKTYRRISEILKKLTKN